MANTESGGGTVEIRETADIRAVPAIHARLIEAFKSSDNIILDVRRADDIDISFLQLIEAARRYAVSSSKTISLACPADGDMRQQLLRGGFLSRDEDRAFWLQSDEVA